MEFIRQRMFAMEQNQLALQTSQVKQNEKLTELQIGQAMINANMINLTNSITRMVTQTDRLTETAARWKGGILLVLGGASLLGPLLVFLVRLIFFGKPLSAP